MEFCYLISEIGLQDMANFKAGTYSKAATSAHDPMYNNHHNAVQLPQQVRSRITGFPMFTLCFFSKIRTYPFLII